MYIHTYVPAAVDCNCVLLSCRDGKEVKRSESFRVFGCMNPATDHGKTPLPPHIRNRLAKGLLVFVV